MTIKIYSKSGCPFCERAKNLLDSKGLSYMELRPDLDPELLYDMFERSGNRTVPQLFIDDKPIGGYDDLAALAKSGELDKLLNQS